MNQKIRELKILFKKAIDPDIVWENVSIYVGNDYIQVVEKDDFYLNFLFSFKAYVNNKNE